MSNSSTKSPLTKPQELFLESYIDDILHGEETTLGGACREEFIRRVTGMDFDGQDGSANWQVAQHLKNKGLLSELEIHGASAAGRSIYVVFSAAGAEAIYDIVKRRQSAEAGENRYAYIYVDKAESRITGEVTAKNAAEAAVKIMGERGAGEKARHARHTPPVKEERLMWAGSAELVIFRRDSVFLLEVRKAGSRKRKPFEFTA